MKKLSSLSIGIPAFLESTFIDQNNPKRQTADPLWGSPKLDLSRDSGATEIVSIYVAHAEVRAAPGGSGLRCAQE